MKALHKAFFAAALLCTATAALRAQSTALPAATTEPLRLQHSVGLSVVGVYFFTAPALTYDLRFYTPNPTTDFSLSAAFGYLSMVNTGSRNDGTLTMGSRTDRTTAGVVRATTLFGKGDFTFETGLEASFFRQVVTGNYSVSTEVLQREATAFSVGVPLGLRWQSPISPVLFKVSAGPCYTSYYSEGSEYTYGRTSPPYPNPRSSNQQISAQGSISLCYTFGFKPR